MQPAIVAAVADPTVQVTLGFPWPQTAQDIIGVGEVTSAIDYGPMGTQRARDEDVTVQVLVSVFRPGGQEVEQVASDRAYALLDAIEHHLRMTDPTLGGLLNRKPLLLTGHSMDSAPFADDTAQGRTVEILATFTGSARIRN